MARSTRWLRGGGIKLMMGVSRTRSAGAKVTDEEYAQLEALAQARGVTLGEWCRDILLSQLEPLWPASLKKRSCLKFSASE